jgi:hypothetical protein
LAKVEEATKVGELGGSLLACLPLMMGSMKLGSKLEAFQRRGQAWFCTSGLANDIKIKV